MMTTTLIGDWNKLANKLRSLPSDIKQGKQQGLERVGKLTVETLKGHVARQDLGWAPLDEDTIKQKGNSDILIETGSLLSNLQLQEVNQDAIFVGANSNVTYPSGANMNEVLKYHEFGTEKEPPRPLVRPSYNEVQPKAKQIIKEEIINAIKK